MSEGSKDIRCPDCGRHVLQKNLQSHYRRLHPGLDHMKRLKESREPREVRRSRYDVRSSPLVAVFTSLAVILVLIMAALIIYDWSSSESKGPPKRDFFYAASDGAVINGTFYPSGTPGAYTIYLFHDLGQDRHIWDDYAEYLQGVGGYNVVTVDLRGHGESLVNVKSAEITYDYRTMNDSVFANMKYDIIGAQKWVTGNGEKGKKNTNAGSEGAVVVVGKLGAVLFNQAARMAAQWGIDSGLYVDPVRGAYGIDTYQASEDWGNVRPMMLLSSEGDSETLLALQRIADNMPENSHVLKIEGNDRGEALFKYDAVRELAMTTFSDGFRIADT